MNVNIIKGSLVLMSWLILGAGCNLFGGSSPTPESLGGVWFSGNQGETWEGRFAIPMANGVDSLSSVDILAFEQDPKDPAAIYAGTAGNGYFYSYDHGTTWQRPTIEVLRTGAVYTIEVDPRDVCTIYVQKGDRVLKSTTCGRTFDKEVYLETSTDERLSAMTLDWYNPQILWLGTSDGDLLRSIDGGGTWAPMYRLRDAIVDIEISQDDSRTILLSTNRNGYFRSTDGGLTWTDMEEAIKEFNKADNIYDIQQSKDGKVMLMASAFGLLKSTDRGASWTKVPLVSASGEVRVRAVAISSTDNQTYYYATANAFYSSDNGGAAWDPKSLPSTRAGNALLVDSVNGDEVFLGLLTLAE